MRWLEHSSWIRFLAQLSGGILSAGTAFCGAPGAPAQLDKSALPEKRESSGKHGSTPSAAPQQTFQGVGNEWGSKLSASEKEANSEALQKVATKPGKESAESEKEREKNPISIPLVPGYDSFGLNIPDHDEAGNLRSLFMIGAISRLDDRSVEIRDSFLETYRDDGSPDLSIELQKAVLDRFTRVLVAKTPVTLRREEFELKGATLEFNTATKEGGLGGPVQMTIYNGVQSDSSTQAKVGKEHSAAGAETSGQPPAAKK